MLYKRPFHLWFTLNCPEDGGPEVRTILSRTGTLQGSALAQLIFDLAFIKPLKALQLRHPGILVTGIHDDVNISGPPAAVAAAYRTLVEECGKMDLVVRPSKCHVSVTPRQLTFRDRIDADFLHHGVALDWGSYPTPYPQQPPPPPTPTEPPPASPYASQMASPSEGPQSAHHDMSTRNSTKSSHGARSYPIN